MRWVMEWWWFGGEKKVMSVLKEDSAVGGGVDAKDQRRSDEVAKEDPSRAVTLANHKAYGK